MIASRSSLLPAKRNVLLALSCDDLNTFECGNIARCRTRTTDSDLTSTRNAIVAFNWLFQKLNDMQRRMMHRTDVSLFTCSPFSGSVVAANGKNRRGDVITFTTARLLRDSFMYLLLYVTFCRRLSLRQIGN